MKEHSARPNKRLKLRSKGSRCVVPWRAQDFVHHPCADAWVARSLSAIR